MPGHRREGNGIIAQEHDRLYMLAEKWWKEKILKQPSKSGGMGGMNTTKYSDKLVIILHVQLKEVDLFHIYQPKRRFY